MENPKAPIPPYVKHILRQSALKDMSANQKQKLMSYYYGKISLIDHYIGKIIDELERQNLVENTWIIYNSDHGEMLGDHKLSHKYVFYEGAINVPLIIRPPGGIMGFECNELTDHLDIASTIMDIAGAKPFLESDGKSLLPIINDCQNIPDSKNFKNAIISEMWGFTMVRTDKFKLVVSSKYLRPVEMYDLHNDPNELDNIVENAEFEKVRRILLSQYLEKHRKLLNLGKYDKFSHQFINGIKKGIFLDAITEKDIDI